MSHRTALVLLVLCVACGPSTAEPSARTSARTLLDALSASQSLRFRASGELRYDTLGSSDSFALDCEVDVSRIPGGRTLERVVGEAGQHSIERIADGEKVVSLFRTEREWQFSSSSWESLPPYSLLMEAWTRGRWDGSAWKITWDAPDTLRCEAERATEWWTFDARHETLVALRGRHETDVGERSFAVTVTDWALGDPVDGGTVPPGFSERRNDPTEGLLSVGALAPEFELRRLDGESVSLGEFRGRPVLLNFWFLACGGCRLELPDLHELARAEDLQVLCVNRGDEPAPVREYWSASGFELPVALDPERRVPEAYGVRLYPTNYLIAADGTVAYAYSGVDLEALRKAVRELDTSRQGAQR